LGSKQGMAGGVVITTRVTTGTQSQARYNQFNGTIHHGTNVSRGGNVYHRVGTQQSTRQQFKGTTVTRVRAMASL